MKFEIDDDIKFKPRIKAKNKIKIEINTKLNINEKYCPKCKTFKLLICFGKWSHRKSGLYPYCKECVKVINKYHAEKNKDARRKREKEYIKKNPEKRLETVRRWHKNNAEHMKEYRKARRPIDRERERLIPKYKNNAKEHKRRASIKQAIPKWYNETEVTAFFAEAEKLGFTVDHIIPIQSKIVCGLHVQNNLQFLTFSENAAKGNRHWPDMPT